MVGLEESYGKRIAQPLRFMKASRHKSSDPRQATGSEALPHRPSLPTIDRYGGPTIELESLIRKSFSIILAEGAVWLDRKKSRGRPSTFKVDLPPWAVNHVT